MAGLFMLLGVGCESSAGMKSWTVIDTLSKHRWGLLIKLVKIWSIKGRMGPSIVDADWLIV
jgi:hypothetical protein